MSRSFWIIFALVYLWFSFFSSSLYISNEIKQVRKCAFIRSSRRRNTDRQLQLMRDLEASVLIGTSSYGLVIAEEVDKRGMRDDIHLKRGIFGSERWGDKIRERIYETLGIEFFDIYGLTEIYGPGIAIDCCEHTGMHYFNDYIYCEIIDPATGKVLPDGEQGEIVITTFRKEAAPLIRYRTRDISRIIPGECPCGSPFPRLDRIVGRSDDMIKVKGTNIYPAQVAYSGKTGISGRV